MKYYYEILIPHFYFSLLVQAMAVRISLLT